ncbi:MAG: DUF3365 domain-containing protein [Bacteroidales bacterium]
MTRKSLYAILTTALLLTLITVNSCSTRKTGSDQLAPETEQHVIRKGKAIASGFVKTLKEVVKTTIDTAGVEAAITTCNKLALPLTDRVAGLAGEGITISRITDKPRNPVNKASDNDLPILEQFRNQWNNDSLPPSPVVTFDVNNGDTLYHYYQPMKMEALCLLCHGTTETLAPGITQVIDSLYPEDQATGYHTGDFRGAIRIDIEEL